jgi:hypothetical protein
MPGYVQIEGAVVSGERVMVQVPGQTGTYNCDKAPKEQTVGVNVSHTDGSMSLASSFPLGTCTLAVTVSAGRLNGTFTATLVPQGKTSNAVVTDGAFDVAAP